MKTNWKLPGVVFFDSLQELENAKSYLQEKIDEFSTPLAAGSPQPNRLYHRKISISQTTKNAPNIVFALIFT